jgi:hypothetical protein
VVLPLLTVYCTKKDSGSIPSQNKKMVYGRVVEEETDLSLASAEFITSSKK